MLRATERAAAVVHVPEILYHWRVLAGSASADTAAKPWAFEAGRRGPGERRRPARDRGRRRAARAVPREFPRSPGDHGRAAREHHRAVPRRAGDDLAACVPVPHRRARLRPLRAAVGRQRQRAPRDPGSSREAGRRTRRCGIVADPQPFDWVAINNAAAAEARGDVLAVRRTTTSRRARTAGWRRCWLTPSETRSARSAPWSATPTSPCSTPASCSGWAAVPGTSNRVSLPIARATCS